MTNYTKDEIAPMLTQYDLDMNEGLIALYFSEVVDYSSLNSTLITLYASNDTAETVTNYTLSAGGEVIPIDDTELYLYIDITDLNEIKRLSELAIDNKTTFLTFTSELVYRHIQ